jgi:hypothetical protein
MAKTLQWESDTMNTLKYIHILSNTLKDIEIYYKDTI